MPLSIEEFAGEARVSAEFLAVTGDISARIEDYPGPHSLVTVGSGIGAHLTAGAGEGISVDLGDSEVGSASAASISAGIVGGTSHAWVVRDSRANATLRDRAIDHLARSASNNIGAQNPIAGAISRKLTDTIVGWETPDATTTYAGLVVAASAFATSGIAGIQSSGKLSTVIATNELRNGRRSYSLTTEGAGSAGIPLGLLGVPADNTSITGAYRSVLSIGTPQNGRIPVVVQHYAESDGRVVMGSNSVVLSQERLGTSIDDVVRQITRGGLEGAAAALKSGVVEVGETQVHRGELLSDDYGLKASAAHVGLAITGTNRSVEFSPVEAAGKPGP
jgi:hypothetical protein